MAISDSKVVWPADTCHVVFRTSILVMLVVVSVERGRHAMVCPPGSGLRSTFDHSHNYGHMVYEQLLWETTGRDVTVERLVA